MEKIPLMQLPVDPASIDAGVRDRCRATESVLNAPDTTEVVFTGQGVAVLQEAGKIGVDTVPFISLPLLGVYPTLQTLTAQLVTVLVIAAGFWWAGCTERIVKDDANEN